MTHLESQLAAAVAQHQCEAVMTTHAQYEGVHVNAAIAGRRCESVDTKVHPTLARSLCWVHRQAADNFRRGKVLRFVESESKK